MMEIDITDFFDNAEHAAVRDSAEYMLLDTPEKVDAWRDYVRGFGAWEDEEIDAWTVEECEALLIQFISGDIREMESLCGEDWEAYRELQERGTVSGRMYRGDDSRVYFYVGE